MWYYREIGKERCPIVDTWWQTETGAIMIAPIPGAMATKPGSATRPFFGIVPEVVTKEGESRACWSGWAVGDQEAVAFDGSDDVWAILNGMRRLTGVRFREATLRVMGRGGTADGYYWLMGRVDDVLNVSGHRLGTMEVESALVAHPKVAEAAVVGRPDDLKGQAVCVSSRWRWGMRLVRSCGRRFGSGWPRRLVRWLGRMMSRFTEALPKTRSGKIMRRLLRELATTGEVKGDTTTLEDFAVIAKLREGEE